MVAAQSGSTNGDELLGACNPPQNPNDQCLLLTVELLVDHIVFFSNTTRWTKHFGNNVVLHASRNLESKVQLAH